MTMGLVYKVQMAMLIAMLIPPEYRLLARPLTNSLSTVPIQQEALLLQLHQVLLLQHQFPQVLLHLQLLTQLLPLPVVHLLVIALPQQVKAHQYLRVVRVQVFQHHYLRQVLVQVLQLVLLLQVRVVQHRILLRQQVVALVRVLQQVAPQVQLHNLLLYQQVQPVVQLHRVPVLLLKARV